MKIKLPANKMCIEKKEYILTAFISFTLKLFMILTASFPLRITGDELFLFYVPAKCAGMDWSSSMDNYRYYGYGFSILLTPLFKYIDNPVIIYRISLIMIAFIQMIIPVICCYLLRNFFNIKRHLYVIIGTLVGTFSVSLYPTYMYNEHIYIVYVWISFFILAKLWEKRDDKKAQIKYSFLLGLSFLGALTVHQRAITLFFAFIILYILIAILLKRRIAFITITGITWIIGNEINNVIMYKIIEWIKTPAEMAMSNQDNLIQVQNTQVPMSFSLKSLQNTDFVNAEVRTLMGNLNTLNGFTVGFFAFSIILGIVLLYKAYLKAATDQDLKLLIFGIFGMSAVLITILGLMNSWGWGICQAYIENNGNADSLRGLVYLRYYICYYVPVLMGIISYLINYKKYCVRYLKYSLLLSITWISYWLLDIMPLMKNSTMGFGVFIIFTPIGYVSRNVIPADYLYSGVFFSLILILIIYLIKNFDKCYWLLIMFTICMWHYEYDTYLGDGKKIFINYDYANQTQKILDKIEENGLTASIYVYEYSIPETGQSLLYEIQFLNMHTQLYKGKPPEKEQNAVYITIYPDQEDLINRGYHCIQIDNNEYMFANNVDTIVGIQNILADIDANN